MVYEAWTADYLPFGSIHVTTGPVPALRLPGQWFQAESGLHQNWMRDYDPTTGRYLQPDPLGLVDGASVYGYARQSPLRYTDPMGQCPICVGIPIILAAILTPDYANAPGQCDELLSSDPGAPYLNGLIAGSFFVAGSEFLGLRRAGEAVDAVAGGAANRAAFEVYKDSLRAGMQRPIVSDGRLSSLLDGLYRPNATIGSGSTAAAVRQELATGASVGGRMHSQKAVDAIRALEKWLERSPAARPGDRAAAENVIRDLRNSLSGK